MMDTTDTTLTEIIKDWSFFDGLPESWDRQISIPKPASDLVTIISGVRRCGKSTLMSQLVKKWDLALDQCFFVNFEDPRLSNNLKSTQILEDIKSYTTRALEKSSSKNIYLFLDEIQNVTDWQKWVRLQVDKPSNIFLIVSGSNSSLLSGEIGSTLTGRHLSFELFPLSINEYLEVYPKSSVADYLNQGGFPRILQEESPRVLLQQYYKDIIERDLRERVKARSVQPIRTLAQQVFESIGSETSIRKLAAASSITVDTASSYLQFAEQAYLLFSCPFFDSSERKRMARNKKYYAIDTAMRRLVVTKTGADIGKDFENSIFLHFKRKFENIYFWSAKKEVDFIVETPEGYLPVQVSWEGIKERHEEALDEFVKAHPHTLNPIYITKENFVEYFSSI